MKAGANADEDLVAAKAKKQEAYAYQSSSRRFTTPSTASRS